MHYTEYNQVCLKCDRPIEYKELGRSIIITPCPCQVTELKKVCQEMLDVLAFVFEIEPDMKDGDIGMVAVTMANILANATK